MKKEKPKFQYRKTIQCDMNALKALEALARLLFRVLIGIINFFFNIFSDFFRFT